MEPKNTQNPYVYVCFWFPRPPNLYICMVSEGLRRREVSERTKGGPTSSSSTHSLFNAYSKLMEILSGAPLLLQYTFLIQFLFKIDENPLWRPLLLQCTFLIQFLCKLMKILSGAPSSSIDFPSEFT